MITIQIYIPSLSKHAKGQYLNIINLVSEANRLLLAKCEACVTKPDFDCISWTFTETKSGGARPARGHILFGALSFKKGNKEVATLDCDICWINPAAGVWFDGPYRGGVEKATSVMLLLLVV